MAAARMNRLRLQREMAARGWNACDLTQAAGLSATILTAGLQGRQVSLRTVQKIAVAIANTQPSRRRLNSCRTECLGC
jgi:DNA-binding Xre family transcriptional regulator